MWHNGWFMGGGLMIVWWIVGLALLVAFVWVIVAATTGTRTPNVPTTRESPEDILRRRFARGEIDREEYRQRLDDLRR